MAKVNFEDITPAAYINEQPVDTGQQRSEEWFRQHVGRFTGSGFSKLMSCDGSVARKSWADRAKWVSFGKTAEKYIYQKAMERKFNRSFDKQISRWEMDYGTRKEPEIIAAAKEGYPEICAEIEECKFIEIKGLEGIAGTSPDGKVIDRSGVVRAGEWKARVSIDKYFDSVEVPYNEKHMDFWQHQGEMLSLEVDSLVYIVAMPPADPFDLDEILRPDDLHVQIIEANRTMQEALIFRILVANEAADIFVKTRKPISECIAEAINKEE